MTNKNSADVNVELGFLLSKGGNGIKKDMKEAAKWYRMAVSIGLRDHQCKAADYSDWPRDHHDGTRLGMEGALFVLLLTISTERKQSADYRAGEIYDLMKPDTSPITGLSWKRRCDQKSRRRRYGAAEPQIIGADVVW